MNRLLTFTASFLVVGQMHQMLAQGERGDRGRGAGHPLLQVLDLDGDGALSKQEWEKTPELLKKLDLDGDSILSRAELRQRREAPTRNRSSRGGGGGLDVETSKVDLGEPGVAWYGRLDLAKEEAKISNRPIMFMAAASQCSGVPGVF